MKKYDKQKRYDGQLSREAVLLNSYLNQYRNCIRKKHTLEYRRKAIIREFDSPLKSVNYDGMPHGSGEGLGCAALSFRLDEINASIAEQMAQAAKALADIMSVIEFLPDNSMERAIIEAKYIDRLGWTRICETHNLTRTPATRYWRKGLYMLLDFEKVKKILKDYEAEENFFNQEQRT